MVGVGSPRFLWDDLPADVRRALDRIVGGRVVEAVSQPVGFSPGVAARVVTTDGRRAFVKAVSPAQNKDSPEMHRREIAVTGALPTGTPAPRLLGSYDDGTWVALVLEDVDGRHPRTPWDVDELAHVLDAVTTLGEVLTPNPLPDAPDIRTTHARFFAGWDRVAERPLPDADPWVESHLDELRARSAHGLSAVAGTTLVHADLRSDNVLIRPDGSVVFVDWPWACVGNPLYDVVSVLVNVALHGQLDVETQLARSFAARAPADDVNGVLAALAGFFLDSGREPDPPGLPTLRSFQHAQGEVTVAWLRRRLES